MKIAVLYNYIFESTKFYIAIICGHAGFACVTTFPKISRLNFELLSRFPDIVIRTDGPKNDSLPTH